jgi:DNA replicative helicase MCM subunit Mcm2 (Cdc46/Mcm family)
MKGEQKPTGGNRFHIDSSKVISNGDIEDVEKSLLQYLKLLPGEEIEPIPPPLLRKYIAYAKRYVEPSLTVEASNILQDFYLTLRRLICYGVVSLSKTYLRKANIDRLIQHQSQRVNLRA